MFPFVAEERASRVGQRWVWLGFVWKYRRYEIKLLKFFYLKNMYSFKSRLHPTWGLNSRPRDPELLAPPTEPDRHPKIQCFKFKINFVGLFSSGSSRWEAMGGLLL